MKTDDLAFDLFSTSVGRTERECLSTFDARIASGNQEIKSLAAARLPAPMRNKFVAQIAAKVGSQVYADVYSSLRRSTQLATAQSADLIQRVTTDGGDPVIFDRMSLADVSAFRADEVSNGIEEWMRVWNTLVADATVGDQTDLSKLEALRWQIKHVARWQSSYGYNGASADLIRVSALAGKKLFKRWIGPGTHANNQVAKPLGMFFSNESEVPHPGLGAFEAATIAPWRKGWATPVYFVVGGQRRWVR